MSELAAALEHLARRGERRDPRAVVAAALAQLDAGRPPRRLRRPLLLVAVAASVATAIVAGAAVFVQSKAERIERVNAQAALSQDAGGDVMTVLLAGVDRREGIEADVSFPPRVDSLMLLRVNRVTGATALLSVPRDLATADDRRISELRIEGPPALIRAVHTVTGVSIDHYVEFDFAGFRDVVDALGGVRIPVSQPMRDELSGLQLSGPGCVTLDGTTALAYVRSRHLMIEEDGRWHTDPTGDLGRIQRQQALVLAAVRQVPDRFTDPRRLNAAIDSVVDSIKADEAFSLPEMLRFYREWARHEATMRMLVVPTTPDVLGNGASVLRLDPARMPEALRPFADDTAAAPATGVVEATCG